MATIGTPEGGDQIEAELAAPGVTGRVIRRKVIGHLERKLRIDGKFRLELCLTPQPASARAGYPDQWRSNRLERIGELSIVPAAVTLLARIDEDVSMTVFTCDLASGYITELFEKLPKAATEQHLCGSLDIRVPKVRNLLVQAAGETRRPGFASEMMLELIARQTAIELVRLGHAIEAPLTQGGLAPWQLRLIEDRLAAACKAPTLSELAELCRISVRQLSRGFRASRGCSIGAHVAHAQMERARRLLASDESLAAIASRLGFSSSSNFCFAFRRATGVTPGQFRNTLQRR
jgi:AraC family transcriptional regulator